MQGTNQTKDKWYTVYPVTTLINLERLAQGVTESELGGYCHLVYLDNPLFM